MAPKTPATLAALSTALTSQALPKPNAAWLHSIISGQRPSTPFPAILATAKLRLLASDLTLAGLLDLRTPSLPRDLSDPSVKSLKLQQDVVVQVLGVEDTSRSRWEQIEAMEAVERGEMTRGREVIRVVPEEADEGNNDPNPARAPQGLSGGGLHKLVLQDHKGQRVFGIELRSVPKVGLGMEIGMKMVLRKGCEVSRGVVMLRPESVLVLGGKIETLHKTWQANRKRDLREAIDAEDVQARGRR